jgi:hypothetical protein
VLHLTKNKFNSCELRLFSTMCQDCYQNSLVVYASNLMGFKKNCLFFTSVSFTWVSFQDGSVKCVLNYFVELEYPQLYVN